MFKLRFPESQVAAVADRYSYDSEAHFEQEIAPRAKARGYLINTSRVHPVMQVEDPSYATSCTCELRGRGGSRNSSGTGESPRARENQCAAIVARRVLADGISCSPLLRQTAIPGSGLPCALVPRLSGTAAVYA
jgi:hypothetical protein